ncbi:AQP4 protein, partial [Polypterus senegalus]
MAATLTYDAAGHVVPSNSMSVLSIPSPRSDHSELKSRRFWRAVLAEILGSLIFVSAVLGSSIPNQGQDCSILLLQPALAAGFTAVGLGHCFGDISGAQVNPAVTLAFLATRKLDILRTASYIIGQCLGATMAAGILYLTIPLKSAARCYVNMINSESNAGQALGMEVLATFQLVFTIFSVEDHKRREVGEPGNLAIGFSLSAGILTAVRYHQFHIDVYPKKQSLTLF